MAKNTKVGKVSRNNKAGYVFVFPYAALFVTFILAPVIMAIFLSFTNFNAIQKPSFVGFLNYINLITGDDVFMKFVLPNTVKYALIVGVGGYVLAFLLAFGLANLTKGPRTVFALILYSPSMTTGVAMSVLWKIMFTGDQTGYLNSWLMDIGVINEPIIWLTNADYLLPIVIIIGLWSSMGVGFLSILAGLLNIDESLYEAAAIDGMIATLLAGNPTPGYAAQLIVNHIEDYGFIRYEMGYAAAVSVVLLLIVQIFSSASNKLFGEKD